MCPGFGWPVLHVGRPLIKSIGINEFLLQITRFTDHGFYSGVLLQTTAKSSAQFTVGRFISFGMTGMTIVVVPIYLAETSPKVLRGMMTSTLQLMIVFGQLIASLVTFGTQHISGDKGWQIPVGLQFIAPALIVALLPLVPESPRW